MKNNERIAIYPGAFDPITKGHISIIKRSLGVADKVIVAIAHDSVKNSLFSVDERCALVLDDINNFIDKDLQWKITVKAFKGLLVNFVHQEKASFIVRGLRAVSDFEYEFQLFSANTRLAPDIETVFLPATDDAYFISSTIVKEVSRLGGDVSKFVSKNTAEKLKQFFN
jgi:pantetheine-phosphate adenylyltransferase